MSEVSEHTGRPKLSGHPPPLERRLEELAQRVAHTSPQSLAMLRVCLDVWDMLDVKNVAYGNSALDPVRIFSKADAAEQLRVRIDDKLSRLVRGHAAGEDALHDLLGYLVLLKVAEGG
jgi:hypothetical protein